MTKLALFAFVVALVLCMGIAFAEYNQNTLTRINEANTTEIETPPTNMQPTEATTSACIDESIQNQWEGLAIQLETAVENNDTGLIAQIQPEIESLGQEILEQIMEQQCSSGSFSVDLLCPVEAAMYASLDTQLNSLKAQEYQARTSGDTELAIQLQAQVESLATEAAKYTEKCQAKILASDTAKYFMSTPLQPQVYTEGNAEHAAQRSEEGVIYSNTTAQEAATASVCYVPYKLEKRLKDAWESYNSLVQTEPIDMEAMAQVKATISSTEAEINKIKQNCQPEPTSATAPGQSIRPGENCTVPVELTQEFEGQWKNYKEALANNDTEKADTIKQKISEIEQKLSITKGQCVKTIVSQRANTSDVVNYYKQQVTEIMTEETDTDAQIGQLKNLRNEIDKLITELISKNKQLNAGDVSDVVDEIRVKARMIQAGNSTIATTEAKISTQINKHNVEVNPSSAGVKIKEGNITLDSVELTIKNNKISINGTEVKILPSAVASSARIQNMKSLNLTTLNGAPVYGIIGDENRKLLWILPVTIEKNSIVDAVTGEIIKEEGPWWKFLTFE